MKHLLFCAHGEGQVCTCGAVALDFKPTAIITQNGLHHYTLSMGDREMGGTNKAALAAYARKQGYKPRFIEDKCCNCGQTRCTCCNGGPL